MEFRRDIMTMLSAPVAAEEISYNAACTYIGLRKAFQEGSIDIDVFTWLAGKWPALASYNPDQLFIDADITTQAAAAISGDHDFSLDVFAFLDEYFGIDKYVNEYSKTKFCSFLNGDLFSLGLSIATNSMYREKKVFTPEAKPDPYIAIMTILKRADELEPAWLSVFAQATQHAIFIGKITEDSLGNNPTTTKMRYSPTVLTKPTDVPLKMIGLIESKLADGITLRKTDTVISAPIFDLLVMDINGGMYYEVEADLFTN